MLKRIKANRIIAFLTATVLALSMLSFSAFAADKGELVVVGANPDFGISKVGSSYSGFAYDFLEQISKYTGHRYTFVEGSPEELMTMLAENKIDIIPCVTEDDAALFFGENEENTALLTNFSLMRRYSAVYVPDSSTDISFYDISSLKKARIGFLAEDKSRYFPNGSFVCTELESAEFIMYNTESQLKTDFFSGDIDAVVKDCFRPWGNEAIVYQFSTSDCYFLTNVADRELCAQLDNAVGSVLTTDPFFAADMYEKYISKYGAQKFAFTAAEKDYIEKTQGITIAYNLESDMMGNYNQSQNKLEGVMGKMIADLEAKTGLSVTITACATLSDCVKLLESGEVDAVCGGVNYRSMAPYGNYPVSMPLYRIPVVAAGKKNSQLTDHSKIAVPFYADDIETYIKELYPTATLLPYKDVKACMDAVNSGEADIVAAGVYGVTYMTNGDYMDIEILRSFSAYHSECITLDPKSTTLFGIIGKALAQMSSADSQVQTFYEMTSYGYSSMTFSRFIDRYLLIIIIALVIMAAEFVVLFTALRRKTKKTTEIDPLTGGRTKQKFLEDSQKAIKKSSPEKWALVLFDINKFKFVNDRLGYEEGDRMLARLYKTVSDSLDDDEVFSRISDDNFAMTVHNVSDNEMTAKLNTIFDEFSRRNSLFVKYPVLFSAGVCRLGQCVEKNGTVDFNAAIDRATIAKKTQKGQHNTSISFYDGKIREKALREKDYENVMPTALKEHEFLCYLQPKYGLESRHIEGAEALIRWNSKEFGFVFPDEFIPLSEKNGFVVELDFYILEEVCKAMRRWMDDGKTPVVISVNQSRLHLNNDDYIWRLREIVDKYEIPYEYIELELTESVFTDNVDHLLNVMQKLHEIGFKLSIDDFGSGYSSLNMLKDIPADVIKIDREFFNGTVNSEKGRAVIETVVGLANNLNMEVISEGVETVEQVDFLSDIHCHMVQGYYFAKPMPMESFEDMWFKDLEQINEETGKAECGEQTETPN